MVHPLAPSHIVRVLLRQLLHQLAVGLCFCDTGIATEINIATHKVHRSFMARFADRSGDEAFVCRDAMLR